MNRHYSGKLFIKLFNTLVMMKLLKFLLNLFIILWKVIVIKNYKNIRKLNNGKFHYLYIYIYISYMDALKLDPAN